MLNNVVQKRHTVNFRLFVVTNVNMCELCFQPFPTSFRGEGKKDGLTLISIGGSGGGGGGGGGSSSSSSICMHQKVRGSVGSDNGRQSAFATQKLI
jgi:hypothetical protein